MGPPGQGKRQPEERDRSRDNWVRYSSAGVSRDMYVCQFHFHYRNLVEKFVIKFILVKLWVSCFLLLRNFFLFIKFIAECSL